MSSTNPFSQLMGHRPRTLPATGRAVLVVQGQRLEPGQRIERKALKRMLDGEDPYDHAAQLDRIQAQRREVARRSRSKRYLSKPETQEKVRARLEATKERRREVHRAWSARNREKLRAYRRELQAVYRADPLKAEAIKAKRRASERARRARMRAEMTPEKLEAHRAKRRAYRAANREHIQEKRREWNARQRAKAEAQKGGA